MEACPKCSSKNIGRISHYRYFCHNCYVEIYSNKGKIKLFQILDDGTAISLHRKKGKGFKEGLNFC